MNDLVYRLLEVLVVLDAVPVAAPGKTVFNKQLVAQVVLIDLIGEIDRAVCVVFRANGRYMQAAISIVLNIGII